MASLPSGWTPGSALTPEYLQQLQQQIQQQLYSVEDPARYWESHGNMVEMGDPSLPYTIRAQYGANPMQGGQLSGYQVYDNTGISGGGQVLNGRPSYEYDASGNLKNTGTLSGFDDAIHLKDALPAAAVAFGGPLLGMGLNGLGLGGSGLGALETVSEGFGPAFEASVANGAAGSSMLPGLETVSEGFGPGFEQSVANGTWQMPGYPADYGSLPLDGVPPPANPYATPNGAPPGTPGSTPGTTPGAPGTPGANVPDWLKPYMQYLGPAATALGALTGSQGVKKTETQTAQLPDYLKGPVGGIIGQAQGLLGQQAGAANTAGGQMMTAGGGLLNRPIAGNGVGQVTLNQPTTATNPYLSSQADDIARRTKELLDANNLSIQGRYAGGAGGYGNTRMGVAQGIGAGKAADYLQGNLANLYGTAYNNDQNRAMTQYSLDQNFYGTQRGQDLAQTSAGAGLLSAGLDTQFQPLKTAADIYGKFSPFGTQTATSQQGGGWQGILGGALSGTALGGKLGWWG